eukprot:SAG31_NODE_67_length_28318_cov_6.493674_20_plen_88_part_00
MYTSSGSASDAQALACHIALSRKLEDPNKVLPASMNEKWKFGVTTTSVEEHIRKLEDWLILSPPSMHVRFLLMTLAGDTRLLFNQKF